MKYKIALAVLIFAMMSVCLFGCGQKVTKENNVDQESMFAIVEDTWTWRIVRHKETNVMYAVSFSSYNCGTFTLLVNPDGTPMVWEEDE